MSRYYSPPPPPHQTSTLRQLWWQYRGFRRNLRRAIGCGALFVVLLLCAGIGALLGPPPKTSTPNARAGNTNPTATTPLQATATATPANIVTGARLGGTADAFTAAFGQARQQASNTAPFYSDNNGPDGDIVTICFCHTEQGTDGQTRVDALTISPGDHWVSITDELPVAAQAYFPSDATKLTDFTDPQIGLVHVYTSALLAKTFPAAAFTSAGPPGPPATPGMFSVSCDQPNVIACNIVLGN